MGRGPSHARTEYNAQGCVMFYLTIPIDYTIDDVPAAEAETHGQIRILSTRKTGSPYDRVFICLEGSGGNYLWVEFGMLEP